jgi:hypothetical protein
MFQQQNRQYFYFFWLVNLVVATFGQEVLIMGESALRVTHFCSKKVKYKYFSMQ